MKFKKIALAIAILIVLNIFFNYGIYTFYKPPQYEDFCPEEMHSQKISTETECTEEGGLWRYSTMEERPIPVKGTEEGWCDLTYTCNKEYRAVKDVYERNVFVVLTILGVLSLLVGIYLITVEAVANGFLFGGILSIVIGSMRYWSAMDDYLRFIISGVALVVLIYVGYKKLSK